MNRWIEERIRRPLQSAERADVDWFVGVLERVMARWDTDHVQIMDRKRHEREAALGIRR